VLCVVLVVFVGFVLFVLLIMFLVCVIFLFSFIYYYVVCTFSSFWVCCFHVYGIIIDVCLQYELPKNDATPTTKSEACWWLAFPLIYHTMRVLYCSCSLCFSFVSSLFRLLCMYVFVLSVLVPLTYDFVLCVVVALLCDHCLSCVCSLLVCFKLSFFS